MILRVAARRAVQGKALAGLDANAHAWRVAPGWRGWSRQAPGELAAVALAARGDELGPRRSPRRSGEGSRRSRRHGARLERVALGWRGWSRTTGGELAAIAWRLAATILRRAARRGVQGGPAIFAKARIKVASCDFVLSKRSRLVAAALFAEQFARGRRAGFVFGVDRRAFAVGAFRLIELAGEREIFAPRPRLYRIPRLAS